MSHASSSVYIIIMVGGKKGNRTEPNRTTGIYRTEPTEISDTCGTGFYRRHRTELFGVISNYLFKSNYAYFKIYLFKYDLLC